MWIVRSLSLVRRTYRFEDSGQAARALTGLLGDGVELANMLERVAWDEDPVQLTICGACGHVGCEVGGYVSPRRLDGSVVLAPSRKGYEPSDDHDAREYGAPAWMRRPRRSVLVEMAEWERLREAGAHLPSAESLPPLTWADAFRMARFEGPEFLGRATTAPLSAEVLATDPWIEPDALDDLGRSVFWQRRTGLPRLARSGFSRLTLFLESPLHAAAPFALTPEGIGLSFEPGVALV